MATRASFRPGQEQPEVERVTRRTKEGRTLIYELKVIQKPERARACGSGAKSSADRRPVDPPPVVQLTIHEVDAEQHKVDVTFSYNANFFLFATLETARPMAHGRVQPAPTQVPVLTGMPVSGMAYLDRPVEAGYFIFPDLSVRHEGRYKLSFNLYEETKEDKDADADEEQGKSNSANPSGPPDSSFDWRMEVKSQAFTVYSAKKFPGLAESTVLSRTVAEQGCRVRIRRDVRMRRRDTKNNYDEDEEDMNRRAQQEAYSRDRSRSMSTGSDTGSPQPFYNQAAAGPHPQGPPGHLGFIQAGQQYQAPAFAQPAPPAPYQAPARPYENAPPPPQHQAAPLPPPPEYYNRPQHPQSAYPTNPPREPQFEAERRASYAPGFPLPSLQQSTSYHPSEANYNRPSYPVPPHSPARQLAPLKSLESNYPGPSSPAGPLSSVSQIAPALHSPTYSRAADRHSLYSQYNGPPALANEPPRNGKRTYDAVFPTSAPAQPLHNGSRPSASHMTEEEEDSMSMEQLRMSYKRADGTSHFRECPVLD